MIQCDIKHENVMNKCMLDARPDQSYKCSFMHSILCSARVCVSHHLHHAFYAFEKTRVVRSVAFEINFEYNVVNY